MGSPRPQFFPHSFLLHYFNYRLLSALYNNTKSNRAQRLLNQHHLWVLSIRLGLLLPLDGLALLNHPNCTRHSSTTNSDTIHTTTKYNYSVPEPQPQASRFSTPTVGPVMACHRGRLTQPTLFLSLAASPEPVEWTAEETELGKNYGRFSELQGVTRCRLLARCVVGALPRKCWEIN